MSKWVRVCALHSVAYEDQEWVLDILVVSEDHNKGAGNQT